MRIIVGMDKAFAIRKAGSEADLARLLGVTRQAVSQWDALPPLRVYQLKELRPRWVSEWRKEQANEDTAAIRG